MRLRTISLTAALCVSAPALLLAQPPAGGPPPGGPGGPGGQRAPFAPKNLKVLSPDTNIIQTMRGFEQALGVQCGFCHAQDPETHRNDFASDANPMKDTARGMIRMAQDINTKYLAQLSVPGKPAGEAPATVSCGTCHRGEKQPPAFVAAPRQPGNGAAPGAPGAAAPPPPTRP